MRLRNPQSGRLVSDGSTTLFAGMWIPRDMVSVAKTTLMSPSTKQSSTASRNAGIIPAWCAATPASSVASHLSYPRTSMSASLNAATRSSTSIRILARSAPFVSRSPASMQRFAASVQAARLKMK